MRGGMRGSWKPRHSRNRKKKADGLGFEPKERLHVRRFSKPVPSTRLSHPSFGLEYTKNCKFWVPHLGPKNLLMSAGSVNRSGFCYRQNPLKVGQTP